MKSAKRSIMLILCIIIVLSSGIILFKSWKNSQNISRAMELARQFSPEHAHGLKFIKPKISPPDKSIYVLKSDDASFLIKFANPRSFEFSLYKEDKTPKNKSMLSLKEARDMALSFVRKNYKSFDKKKYVLTGSATLSSTRNGIGAIWNEDVTKIPQKGVIALDYTFRWQKYFRVGKYNVTVPTWISVRVDAERHIVTSYSTGTMGNFSAESFKPIIVDKRAARKITSDYLEAKGISDAKNIEVKGPSAWGNKPEDMRLKWSVNGDKTSTIERIKTESCFFLDIDATNGQVVEYSECM